ncbi:MAG: glycosyltransferase family 2 protein [Lachnospiraceae bacterium]|nr:glycosyltransferase family 2 protein [Lachnospiraceae bacterium]
MKTIELVTPSFNEEKCIEKFIEEVDRVFSLELPDYQYLVTYVDDGSSDKTLVEIKRMEEAYGSDKVHYISFSRNFGKESAIYAGLCNCVGDYVVLLDVDLQHPVTLIPEMLKAIEEEGYDCATARRTSRKGEGKIKSFFSRNFYHLFNHITGLKLMPGATDFRLMKREVAQAIAKFSERERFTKGIYSWIGFQNKWIPYANVERTEGESKWSMRGLARYSLNGFLAFATTPLRAIIYMGLLIVAATVVWIIKILVDYLAFGVATGNGVTTLTLITLFLGGMVLTVLGVIGEYMARIYMEVKNRPIYITRETNIGCQSEKQD